MDGGSITAEFLKSNGVDTIFTLIGGHISPILVASKKKGIKVIDVRQEVTAVFAADAWARLKGIPGVAVVTAGPGVTNTITAVRNALMAQSPLLLLGGATATILKGRGSLQDIDQITLMKSNVKKTFRVTRLKNLLPTLQQAWYTALQEVPGPVFVELPVDLLYDQAIVRRWYEESMPKGKSLANWLLRSYLKWHLKQLFAGLPPKLNFTAHYPPLRQASPRALAKVATQICRAQRPLLLVGSQAVCQMPQVSEISRALAKLNLPVYLSGMARGLLGANHPLQLRHRRKEALREADLILLLGVPADFRLNYGAQLNRKAYHINVNLSPSELKLNKKPNLAICAHPGQFLLQLEKLAVTAEEQPLALWWQTLREREAAREAEIAQQAQQKMKLINPLAFFLKAEEMLPKKTILVADGGDFVATASYILRPRGPLTWLDPGVFGTLGVGAGFALGAKLAFPQHEVIIVYGDGSAGYSLIEFDTFARHKIPIGAIIGNDACWMQIYRDQINFLQDEVACLLDYSPYEQIAKTFGGEGMTIRQTSQIEQGLNMLFKALTKRKSFVLNVLIGRSDFRKGSISI